jgi:magnesium-protoporphyrin O-methyltransferase
VADCCGADDYQAVFSDRFARRTAKHYRRHGLSPAARRIVEFVAARGVVDATVLEIGGGIGDVQLELLRRGAAHVTNLELSSQYESEAAQLLAAAGIAGQVDRRFLDIAQDPDDVEPADVVVMHRVVCCYPDHARLLSAAARHAKRLLVFSYPSDSPVTRLSVWSGNLIQQMRGNTFRGYLHPPAAMVSVLEAEGLRLTYHHHAWDWDVVGLER